MGFILKDGRTKEEIQKEELKRALKENEIILLLLPNEKYSEKIVDVAKIMGTFGSVCYVSLNKPYKTLVGDFEKRGVKTGKFFFIDCVTKKVREEKEGEQVVYVSSPRALTEINITLKKVLEAGKIDIAALDSLSTLLIYEDPHVVLRFSHSVISAFRMLGSKGILIALKDDAEKELIKDLNMFVDKVLELGS